MSKLTSDEIEFKIKKLIDLEKIYRNKYFLILQNTTRTINQHTKKDNTITPCYLFLYTFHQKSRHPYVLF
ncbi:hypothetical protein BJM56_07355 [Listeria monocytogenes]|nr:hypothetical protein BJM56_07355 [Listeria monocytogenes]